MGLHEVCAAQAGLGGWARSCGHAAGGCCCSLVAGGPRPHTASEPAAGVCCGVHGCGHHVPRYTGLSTYLVFGMSSVKKSFCIRCKPFVCTLSGLLLWPVCALNFLGPGAVQQSLLSDTTRPPSHASGSPAVPAGVEGGHAGCKGDMPHVLCQGV